MLAAYLVWHLRNTLAPLTYTDTQTPTRQPRRPRPPLDHLATLTRNRIRTTDTAEFDQLTEPTPPNAAPSNSSRLPSR